MNNAQKVYSEIAQLLIAINNCEKVNNQEWKHKHSDKIDELVNKYLPHGSGFDSGTKLDYDESLPSKLVFKTAFHHMDEYGYYDNWTYHTIIIRADLAFGIDIKVTGRDRNDIKEHIHSCFADF